jgi:O-antigen/teichoic acid export membrane protein
VREIATVVPRARQDVAFHWAISLLSQYGGLALGLALLLGGQGARGFLLGLGAAALASGLWAAVYSLRRSAGPVAWDGAFCLAVSRSARPVVPMALAQMALVSLDYLFVTRFVGTAALATYGLAYTFASPVMIGVAALNFTLLPEFVSRQRRGEAELRALVDRLLVWGWGAGLTAVSAGVVLGPVVIGQIAGEPYRGAGDLLPLILAAYVLFALGQVLHVVRSARRAEVRASAVVTVACAVINGLLGLWLIPIWGIRGAAVITLLSLALYFLGMAVVVRPLLPGPPSSLVPRLALFGLVAGPVAVVLDPSASTRTLIAAALFALAIGLTARTPTRSSVPAGRRDDCEGMLPR